MATYHPAAVLRNPNQMEDALKDFLVLREKIKEICPATYDNIEYTIYTWDSGKTIVEWNGKGYIFTAESTLSKEEILKYVKSVLEDDSAGIITDK